jgi:hypothetical protein
LAGLFLVYLQNRSQRAVNGPRGKNPGRQTADRFALSNPTELINLGWIAEPGIGPAAGRIGRKICALAASRSWTHIPS